MESDNLRAIALMVAAMAAFAVLDFLLKLASAAMPTGQVLVALSGGLCLVFAAICVRRGSPLADRSLLAPLVVTRCASEVGATTFFVTALTLNPLSLVSAVQQATPIFVTMGAALWLREPVGWRRWAAVLAGLAGVLVIIRPGLAGFEASALLAVGAAVCLAIRDLVSRRMPAEIGSDQLSLWAYALLLPFALVLMLAGPPMTPATPAAWGLLVCAVAIGAVAYLTLLGSTRIGDLSVVIPFRYSRLIFALLLGIGLLGERPDAPTYAGAAIVVASGLYTWLRERRRRHALSMTRRSA